MDELLELNKRLSYLQGEFVNEVIKRGFWGPGAFLEENEITDLDEIIFLQKYLRHVFRQCRKAWMEEGYENHFEAREINKRKFRKHDKELTEIIKTKRIQP
jgi:hypothetical protein|tara:strand:+ start:638 stop:940 length:303 start_codon:yes stop_codon:yes gene_type:complete